MTRRRVFMTAGLSASAAVLAMAVQAGASGDEVAGSPFGDSAVVDVTAPDAVSDIDDE
ncbi:hypothetical protein ABFT23_04305 [Nocardioides sp. C4-1]|uniref:hypothetical protein n=1 Tax=Nocardioides sp. C4-1 TaxID=3151851 RepID=UPI0032635633